jgi:hypothetical protein
VPQFELPDDTHRLIHDFLAEPSRSHEPRQPG